MIGYGPDWPKRLDGWSRVSGPRPTPTRRNGSDKNPLTHDEIVKLIALKRKIGILWAESGKYRLGACYQDATIIATSKLRLILRREARKCL